MKNQLCVSLFETFKNHPDRIGYAYKKRGADQWSEIKWSEVEQRIRQIAYALLDHGVKHQDKVAIYAQNSLEWLLTDVAIMAIGGVTTPIYATNTANQAAYILKDASVQLLFAGDAEQVEKAKEVLDGKTTPLNTIVSFNNEVAIEGEGLHHFDQFIDIAVTETLEQEFNTRFAAVSPEDLATLIYTSGTTGDPKGVMLSHENFLATIDKHDEYLSSLNDNDHSLCFLPLSHVFERSWSLYCMHRGLKNSILTNPKLVAETLREIKPSLFCTVPLIYEKIYNEIHNRLATASNLKKTIFHWSIAQGKAYYQLKNQGKKASALLSLKKSIANKLVLNKIKDIVGGNMKMSPTAGAPLSAEIQSFMIAAGIPIVIGYGLTETTATVTAFPENNYEIGSVGKVLEGIDIKIGANDEILVKATTVMKGYYNKANETAEVFEGEWFKTGDAGRIDANGNLYITDRIKNLMKTSGGKYLVPQQIESMLTNDNFIEQAVLIADGKPYASALIVPNFEALKNYAASLNLSYADVSQLLSQAEIKAFFEEKINSLQKDLANYEKVRKIKLMAREFSMELEELTPTLKIRRKIILDKFQQEILDLYSTDRSVFVM
ncbi:AMP-dependent synthetase/ligase [Robertkochia sediminum]|uniref:AMP-dependent synthetase/ligase n=1 Tax=Robertkochia sediminum TaxID=2785326 RepID=UPI001933DBA3|nr:long-chain fatty acid--CoA ligase [Robertkochia sediminum]MBL7471200.1 long-chain fatty acid--CoA ligase [Robertkochia sediminum]